MLAPAEGAEDPTRTVPGPTPPTGPTHRSGLHADTHADPRLHGGRSGAGGRDRSRPVSPTCSRPRPRRPPPSAARRSSRRRWSGPAGRRLQRGLVLGGAFGTVTVGFAVAPYLTFIGLALTALLVRTQSWTTQAARERQHLRGARRWYDAPMTVLTTPWYLLVAAGGSALLAGWSAMVTFVVGVVGAMFEGAARGAPARHGSGARADHVVGTGRQAAATRRAGSPLHSAATRGSAGPRSRPWRSCWCPLLAYGAGEISWRPAPGAPWREGTLLNRLLGFV